MTFVSPGSDSNYFHSFQVIEMIILLVKVSNLK